MIEWLDSKKEELVLKENQGLVRYIVEKFNISYNDFDDFVSIGNLGLLKAARTFDSSKGIAFATYATTCIMNEIRMVLRKQKSRACEVSLYEPISVDSQGNELTLCDKIPNPNRDFTEEIAVREIFIRFINIILNLLMPRERLIMLYKIAGISQICIAKTLSISQSYISRLEKKLSQKVKSYLINEQQFKEVFSMTMKNDLYRISFSAKEVKNFNKVFAKYLQNSVSDLPLPDFNISCNKERIVILLPADPESFSFIAQIIQEIDNFNMTYVSDRTIESLSNEKKSTATSVFLKNVESKTSPKISEVSIPINDMDGNVNESTIEKNESCSKRIINYISTISNFSTNQVRKQFPEISYGTINAALQFAKRKGLIKSTTRGNYEVISNNDNAPKD